MVGMNRIILLLVLFLFGPLFAEESYAPRNLIYKLKPSSGLFTQSLGSTGTPARDILSSLPVASDTSLQPQSGVQLRGGRSETARLIRFSEDVDLDAIEAQLNQASDVAWAHKDFIFRLAEIPNDPGYDVQWYLEASEFEKAWDVTHGSSSIVVAVIDSGVNYNHVDLVNKMWTNTAETPGNDVDDDGNGFVDDTRGWDFGSRQEGSNDPMDHSGHGTLVAGIIAAQVNNNIGIAGGGYLSEIIPIRVTGASENILTSSLVKALAFSRLHNVDVVNMSLGGIIPKQEEVQALREAIQLTLNDDIVVVVSAGNVSPIFGTFNIDDNNFLPATIPGVITVSAAKESTLTFDPDVSLFGESVDITAGGSSIFSTYFDPFNPNNNEEYLFVSGTSFSAPVVSGAVALLRAYNTSLSTADVYEAITQTATDKGPSGKDNFNGFGLLNITLALSAVDDTPPTLTHTAHTTATLGEAFSITATATDNVLFEATIQGTAHYQYRDASAPSSSTFSTINLVQSGSSLSGTIPAGADADTVLDYYLEIVDLAGNEIRSPLAAPTQVHQVSLLDRSGPSISSEQTLSQFADLSSPIVFLLSDQTEVATASIEVLISGNDTELTLSTSDAGITFLNGTLTLAPDVLEVVESAVSFSIKITAEDTLGNSFNKTFELSQSSEFNVLGAQGGAVFNAPNPFNPLLESTSIGFELTQPGFVTLQLFSLSLEQVYTVTLGDLSTGYHTADWDGRDSGGDMVPNGVYIFILKATNGSKTIIKRNKIAVLRRAL